MEKTLTKRQQYLLDNFGLVTYYSNYSNMLVVEEYAKDNIANVEQINKDWLISCDLLEGEFGEYYKITFKTGKEEEPEKTITVSKWRVLIGYKDKEATEVMCLFINVKGNDKLHKEIDSWPMVGINFKPYVKNWDN